VPFYLYCSSFIPAMLIGLEIFFPIWPAWIAIGSHWRFEWVHFFWVMLNAQCVACSLVFLLCVYTGMGFGDIVGRGKESCSPQSADQSCFYAWQETKRLRDDLRPLRLQTTGIIRRFRHYRLPARHCCRLFVVTLGFFFC
jgi:hypothetical protein